MAIFSGPDRINNNNENNDEDKCCSSYFRPTVKQCFLFFLKAFSPLNSARSLLTLPSIFDQKVSLRDWWLKKAENDFQGKRLAVAGFTSGEQRALRVFHSAPITKRYDICTLETADGVTVIFQSSINKTRTMENGFPSQAFHHFLLGFPPYWEEYAENCFEQAVNSGIDLQNTSNLNKAMTDPGTEDATPISSPSKHKVNKIDASKECAVANGAYMDNINTSNFDRRTAPGDEGVDLTVTNKSKSKKKNQNKGNRYILRTGFTGSSSRGPDAISGCINDEVICEESSFASPTIEDTSILKQPSNNFEDTIMSSTSQTVVEVNDVTPVMVEKGSVNAIPFTSGSKKYGSSLRYLKDNQKQKPVSGRSMQQENKEAMSEVVEPSVGRKLKKSSHSILQEEDARPKEMLKAARRLRNLSDNLKSKEQNEQISVKKGGSSMKKARRKITFDGHASPLTGKSKEKTCISKEKTCILSPESLSLKRSRSGRLLLPTLDFWRNQIPVYDADRNITGIQEELRLYGGSKSEPQKKQKKK